MRHTISPLKVETPTTACDSSCFVLPGSAYIHSLSARSLASASLERDITRIHQQHALNVPTSAPCCSRLACFLRCVHFRLLATVVLATQTRQPFVSPTVVLPRLITLCRRVALRSTASGTSGRRRGTEIGRPSRTPRGPCRNRNRVHSVARCLHRADPLPSAATHHPPTPTPQPSRRIATRPVVPSLAASSPPYLASYCALVLRARTRAVARRAMLMSSVLFCRPQRRYRHVLRLSVALQQSVQRLVSGCPQ